MRQRERDKIYALLETRGEPPMTASPASPEEATIEIKRVKEYTTPDLQKALKIIDGELERRKQADKLKQKLFKMAKEAGVKITIEEGGADFAGEPVKYRNPANAHETWTGRGRKPKWLLEEINKGKKQEDFEIKEPPPSPGTPPLSGFKEPEPAKAKM
jgi:DNA-binding protein H-NS